VTVTVTPVNDAPVAKNNAYTTKEDKKLTVSAPGLLGNDTDVEGSSLTALLVTSPKHGKLTLNADGSFVYKPVSNFYGTDSFTYRANDGSANSNVAKVTLTITAVNDRPTDVVLSRNKVAENKPEGTVVGTLSTVDPDKGDTFTYKLVAGLGDADNGKFKIEGNVLKTAAKFNYEAKKEYSIRVQSVDKGGLTKDKVLTILVTNVNEKPTNVVLSRNKVAENKPAGTVVGKLSTVDPDEGDTFSYKLVTGLGDKDNGKFKIEGTFSRRPRSSTTRRRKSTASEFVPRTREA
jgi:VCBS repeat-containing protein